MKSFQWIVSATLLSVMFFVVPCLGHTPYMACYDNGDGTITCYGEFSDGSSGAGTAMRVTGPDGNILLKGVMDQDGEYTFKTPRGAFMVIFDAGPGHVVMEKSNNIVE